MFSASRLFSVPPAIFLCAHIDVEVVAAEDGRVFLYSVREVCAGNVENESERQET